ncbi:MM0924 family protein [Methanomethylovorans sp.]|uniref:MM0924 family protein n=1 Tax=Methanomethylovorans sp. TaxID=2758717 RepID=UPI00351C4368
MMEDFILKYFLNKTVTIYCGGIATFKGKIKQCENGIIHLEIIQGRYTSIAIDKIITINT